jgi:hypothetical protein
MKTTDHQLTPDEFAAEYAGLDPASRLRLRKLLALLVDQRWARTVQDERTAEAEDALTLARLSRDREAWRSRQLARQHRAQRRALGLPVL